MYSNSYLVYGFKVEEKDMKRLLQDRKENPEDNLLFWMHHDWEGLNWFLIGEEENPIGMVVGTMLWHEDIPHTYLTMGDTVDLELVNKAYENTKHDSDMLDYMTMATDCLELEEPPKEMKLHHAITIFREEE